MLCIGIGIMDLNTCTGPGLFLAFRWQHPAVSAGKRTSAEVHHGISIKINPLKSECQKKPCIFSQTNIFLMDSLQMSG